MIKVFGRITGRYLSSTARNTNNATAGAKAEVLKANALEMNNLLPAIPGALTVQRVSGGGFVAGDTIHRGGLVLAAGRALLWDTAQFGLGNTASLVENHNDNKNSNNDITDASVFRSWDPAKVFAIFALLHPTPEIVVIGSGAQMQRLPSNLRSYLNGLGMQVEVMSSRHAASTYNLLLTEGRNVAAALLPVVPTSARTGLPLVTVISGKKPEQ